jgi:hypothetical protein
VTLVSAAEIVRERLRGHLDELSDRREFPFGLEFSVGVRELAAWRAICTAKSCSPRRMRRCTTASRHPRGRHGRSGRRGGETGLLDRLVSPQELPHNHGYHLVLIADGVSRLVDRFVPFLAEKGRYSRRGTGLAETTAVVLPALGELELFVVQSLG